MIDTVALREKVLDLAIRGKLVPQDPNDEPASVLLERIRAQKQQMVKEGKLKAKDIKDDSVIFKGEDNLHYEKFADGSVKCIEDEIPFELPTGWAWSKINNIAFVTKLAGFEYTKYIAPTLCEDGVPLFKGKNVQDSKIIYDFESYIPEQVSGELSRSQITRKCILTPYVGTIGNIGIHDRVGKFHLGSNVGKIELYNSSVILMEEYVVTYLKSSFGYKQLTKHMKATAQASISIEAIRDVYIPIPPANEQIRMWDAISETLFLIENIESLNGDIADIIKLSKSKILDLAIRGKLVPQNPDDEPASVLLERIRAEKEELIKQGKIKRDKKESAIFKGEDNSYYVSADGIKQKIEDYMQYSLPEGWVWICLKDVATISSGKTPTSELLSENGKIPYYKISDMNVEGNELFLDKTTNYLNDEYDGVVFNKGSFVFPKNGGAVLTNKKRILLHNSLVDLNTGVITFSPFIDAEYAFLMFSFIDFSKLYKGSTIPTVDANVISNLIFALPPLNEQQHIVQVVKKTFAQLDAIADSLN